MLAQRVVTAILLVAGFLAALFLLPAAGWTALAALVLVVGAWEWAGLARVAAGGRIAYAALMGIAATLSAVALGLSAGRTDTPTALFALYGAALLFWIFGAPMWLRRHAPSAPRGLVLLVGWVVLIPTFLALVHLRNMHPLTLLGFMAIVWIADIAAFFSGRRFGRRKLAPHVSPGKTWEGVYGALAATAIYAIAWTAGGAAHAPALVRDLPLPLIGMLTLIAALTLLSVIGDLFESAMKRQAGLKDSGRILPGHGGVLDRIDALTPVLPLAALVCMIV
jgi:phosphatidate cytidylyltransferase